MILIHASMQSHFYVINSSVVLADRFIASNQVCVTACDCAQKDDGDSKSDLIHL